MKRKINIILLILIAAILVFVGVNSMNTKKNVKTVEKENSFISEGKIKYSYSNYKLPELKDHNYNILKADKNKLYILVGENSEDTEDSSNKKHEEIIIYDFQNENIIKTVHLQDDMNIVDLIINNGEVYISYKDLTTPNVISEKNDFDSATDPTGADKNLYKTKNCIAHIDENDEITVIDELYANNNFAKFVMANGSIYYNYEEDGKYGLKTISNNTPEKYFSFKNIDGAPSNISSNGKMIFTLVNEGNNSYFYCIPENKEVFTINVEGKEQIQGYTFLESGILASYLDINDNEKSKMMYVNLKNDRKKIYEKELMLKFASNNIDNCLMVDTATKLHYLYVKDNNIYENIIDEFSGNQYKIYENESTRYGILDVEKNIYIDIYFE